MAAFANQVAGLVVQLRGERAATDTGTISFENAIDLADASWRDAKSDATTGADRIGRSDEWIRTKVDVQHGSLGTFRQDRFPFVQ